MSEEWWLCGQIIGGPSSQGRYRWDFQGIFSTEQAAVRACKNNRYFIQPVELDKEYPEEPITLSRGYYPLVEKELP